MTNKVKSVLTIAGSDSSGGAGIQADIKTISAFGLFATSSITALTAQNTLGVKDIYKVSPEFLKAQLEAVFSDIYPDAIKIGMLSSELLIKTIAKVIKKYQGKNIVLDPVMVSTSGSKLLEDLAIKSLEEDLFPLADIITPNIPEGEVLLGRKIVSKEDMERAAIDLGEKYGVKVLLKGGHFIYDANDLLYNKGKLKWFLGRKIENPNTHGTGCTLSSAIASNLALGFSIEEAIRNSKDYIEGALEARLDLGQGSGPLDHQWRMR